MYPSSTVNTQLPEWYTLERKAEKSIKRLSTLKELDYYIKHPDEQLRRLAILRINELKLKDSFTILKEILDEPMETQANKDLAAWTLKYISAKLGQDLFISHRLLTRYTGNESFSELYNVVVDRNLPSPKLSFSDMPYEYKVKLKSSDILNAQISLPDTEFDFKGWLANCSKNSLANIRSSFKSFFSDFSGNMKTAVARIPSLFKNTFKKRPRTIKASITCPAGKYGMIGVNETPAASEQLLINPVIAAAPQAAVSTAATSASLQTAAASAPAQVSVQVPAQVLMQVPAQMPAQMPVQMSTQMSAQMSTQMSAQMPTQMPVQMPAQMSAQMPTQMSAQMPTQMPVQMPAQMSAQMPTQMSAQMPAQVPVQETSASSAAQLKQEVYSTKAVPQDTGLQSFRIIPFKEEKSSSPYSYYQETKKHNPIGLKKVMFEVLYILLFPVRTTIKLFKGIYRNKFKIFAALAVIYCFLVFTTFGRALALRYTGVDLRGYHLQAVQIIKSTAAVAWAEIKDLTGLQAEKETKPAKQAENAATTAGSTSRTYTVTAKSGLNVRTSPSSSAAKAGEILENGTKVTYLDKSSKDSGGRVWYYVRTSAGINGWVYSGGLK